jgi:hypothetical protein
VQVVADAARAQEQQVLSFLEQPAAATDVLPLKRKRKELETDAAQCLP